jgi:RNA polymerase sigma-70 factor (ECF subfamily)
MKLPGSRRQMEQLVTAHYAELYRYAYRLTGSPTEAEDLTQETFCQAQLKYYQIRDPSRARAWLFSILRHAYLHRVRARKQEHCVPLDWLSEQADPLPVEEEEVDPERLQAALQELPEEFRTPIILFYFDGFSYRDIAEQMQVPLGTVMSRLARAKAHLRARLFAPTAGVRRPSPGG